MVHKGNEKVTSIFGNYFDQNVYSKYKIYLTQEKQGNLIK